ncbi:MAG: hypothetical protein ABDK94_03935 [Atribacterota bacterium]
MVTLLKSVFDAEEALYLERMNGESFCGGGSGAGRKKRTEKHCIW